MEKVTVCITVFNREKYLDQCIKSILNQSHTNLEIIIIDDNSTDNSWKIIKSYSLQDKRIVAIKNDHNIGPYYSLSKAYNLSTSNYVSSVDSDDYIDKYCVEKTLRKINEEPEVGVVYTYCGVCGEKLGIDNRAKFPFSKENLLKFMMTFHFRLIRKVYWNLIEPELDITYYYDYDLVIRLSEVCEFLLLPEVLYYWRRHPEQFTIEGNIEFIKMNKNYIVQEALKRRNNLIGGETT